MSDRSHGKGVTEFRLGEGSAGVSRESPDGCHEYSFPLQFKRAGHSAEGETRVSVRLRSSQVLDSPQERWVSLARWIAEVRLKEHFAATSAPPSAAFEVTDQEVAEFFREVDQERVDRNRDRWLAVPPPRTKIGF